MFCESSEVADMYETAVFTNMCMVYDNEGNVVVQDRVSKNWGGITFPGGHVEKDEFFADAVIREVFEETGLTIWALQMCGVKDWFCKDGARYIVFCYKTNHFSGTLTSSQEGEVKWVKLDDMYQMKLADGMEDMLRVFLEDEISEQCFRIENGRYISMLK